MAKNLTEIIKMYEKKIKHRLSAHHHDGKKLKTSSSACNGLNI